MDHDRLTTEWGWDRQTLYDWEPEGDARTLADRAIDSSFTTMHGSDALDNCEPKSRSAFILRSSWIDAIETVEYSRQMFRGNSTAVVGH